MKRILWFRRDLRCEDNPLLSLEGEVLPIFIFDTHILSKLPPDDRRVTFIYHALNDLKQALKKRGLDLAVFHGRPAEVFSWLLSHQSFDEVCASGDYDPYAIGRDRDVSHQLPFHYLHDTYIFRPEEVVKNDHTPYLVFTPFYNRAKSLFTPAHMAEYGSAQQHLLPFDYTLLHRIEGSIHTTECMGLESIGFIPQTLTPKQLLSPEEKLVRFADKIGEYAKNRDYFARDAVSSLSADLRFGTISIRRVLRWLLEQKKRLIDTEPFFRQLIFREFYAMLLYHFPHLSERNLRYPFAGMPNEEYFKAFCTAQTGVPIIDAGVRELLQTGEMHNRVRMIAASFFTKNLLLPWQWGEAFFAEHLIDYDAASNILSWQWSAGTGVDPQPYFRIFNPYTQAAKFDPEGSYLYHWLPEIRSIAPKRLGVEETWHSSRFDNYPQPIVDQKQSSNNALRYFQNTL